MMSLDPKIEKGIQRFIKYIRRMDSIKDDNQLEILLQICTTKNPDSYTSIGIDLPGHVTFIRQMALRTDDQLRDYFVKQINNNDLVYQDIFTNAEKQRAIKDMQQSAKDLKADPRQFARKVDAEFRR